MIHLLLTPEELAMFKLHRQRLEQARADLAHAAERAASADAAMHALVGRALDEGRFTTEPEPEAAVADARVQELVVNCPVPAQWALEWPSPRGWRLAGYACDWHAQRRAPTERVRPVTHGACAGATAPRADLGQREGP